MTNNNIPLNDGSKYGALLKGDARIFRQYFAEMVRLIGIQTFYRCTKPGKTYTTYAEIDSNYEEPIQVGVIYHDHPDQKTLKKMGWVSELSEEAIMLDVPYDLVGIQKGCLFLLPSGLDNGQSRLFRVNQLQNSVVYPTAITCELVPEFENTLPRAITNHEFKNKNFTLMRGGDIEK
jgi:hypothetical protein